jgi:hypothetical protein
MSYPAGRTADRGAGTPIAGMRPRRVPSGIRPRRRAWGTAHCAPLGQLLRPAARPNLWLGIDGKANAVGPRPEAASTLHHLKEGT